MITVILQGGLGNQLFQYAFGRALMEKGKDVIFDTSFFAKDTTYTKRNYLLDKFLLTDYIRTVISYPKQKLLTRVLLKLDPSKRVRYEPVDLSKDNYIADGYYVSPKYFSGIRDVLLKEIVLREKSEAYIAWEKKIKSAKNPVMIHARKTDYVGSSVFANVDETYFKNALSHINGEAELFCFSDNVEWLAAALQNRNYTMVSGQGCTDYEEMMLMSLCQDFIISNSTFSWWGAWLAQDPNKRIFSPKKWYIPASWEQANKDAEFDNWTRV